MMGLQSNCVCDRGFYSTDPSVRFPTCLPCPVGGNCSALGVTQYQIKALPTYFLGSDETHLAFFECFNGEACSPAEDDEGDCAFPHTGRLCARCEAGYAMESNVCQECGSKGSKVIFLVIAVAALGLLLGFVVFRATKIDSVNGLAVSQAMVHFISKSCSLFFKNSFPLFRSSRSC